MKSIDREISNGLAGSQVGNETFAIISSSKKARSDKRLFST
jgi:hypothetical protein